MTINYNSAGTAYYRCIRQRDSGKSICSNGYIRATALDSEVLASIRAEVIDAIQFDELVIPQQSTDSTLHELKSVQTKIVQEISRSQQLFDQYTEGHLLDEQYIKMSQTIQKRIQSLQKTRE